TNAGQNCWQSTLEVPKDGKLHQLTVRFTNGVDLPTSETILVQFQERGKESDEGDENALGSINGTLEGQGGVRPHHQIQLLDENGKSVLLETRTDDKGAFAFEKVKPGTYTLFAVMGQRRVVRKVTVKPGVPLDVGELQMR